MKEATWTVEFTTHVLANGMLSEDQRDKFQRDSQGDLIWQQSWWYSAFTRAIDLAHLRRIKAADIHMNLTVRAPTASFRRRYGDDKYRTHEAIMPGTRVTFEAVVADHVTKSNLEAILDRMGKFIGLSPYGYKLGFGKFNVLSVNVAASDNENSDNKNNSSTAVAKENDGQ